MNLFEKQVPFRHIDGESKTYKHLTNCFSFLFGNDQRNVVFFALGLGIPAISISFVGLWLSAKGNIFLEIFSGFITLFVMWTCYMVYRMLKHFSEQE